MRIRLIDFSFIFIGVVAGIILSLQIQAKPVFTGSFPLDQLKTQKSLISTFALEQESLKKKLEEIKEKHSSLQKTLEKYSSKKTLQTLDRLKQTVGLTEITGEGIRISLNDNPSVSRFDFSGINENFVQAADIRDLVNALFLKDAVAVAVNGKRISPLTSIQSVFDSILIGNFQTAPPFIFEAVGNSEALAEAKHILEKRKIQIFADYSVLLRIPALESVRQVKFISLND